MQDKKPAGAGHMGRDREVTGENALLQTTHSFRLERHGADDHEVKENSSGPDVNRRTQIVVIFKEFGSGVRRRSTEGRQSLVWAGDCGEAEVANFHALGMSKENVLSLQISVYDVLIVLKNAEFSFVLLFKYDRRNGVSMDSKSTANIFCETQ